MHINCGRSANHHVGIDNCSCAQQDRCCQLQNVLRLFALIFAVLFWIQRDLALSVFYTDERGSQIELDAQTSKSILQQAATATRRLQKKLDSARCARDWLIDSQDLESKIFSIQGQCKNTYTFRIKMMDINNSKLELEILDTSDWVPARIVASSCLPSVEDQRLLIVCHQVRSFVATNIANRIPGGMKITAMNPNLW